MIEKDSQDARSAAKGKPSHHTKIAVVVMDSLGAICKHAGVPEISTSEHLLRAWNGLKSHEISGLATLPNAKQSKLRKVREKARGNPLLARLQRAKEKDKDRSLRRSLPDLPLRDRGASSRAAGKDGNRADGQRRLGGQHNGVPQTQPRTPAHRLLSTTRMLVATPRSTTLPGFALSAS